MTERLWALARAEAFNKHAHYSLEADKQGHVQGMNDAEWGFSTCPHPDCVLVRAALSRQAEPHWQPFAAFDEPLDCIRLVLRDCSTVEIRINEWLTIMRANYDADGNPLECGPCVGVVLKGVAHAFKSAESAREVAETLNAMMLSGRSTPATGTLDADTEKALRRHLWLGHGHEFLYGDDGEMQCGKCAPIWDYRRAPLADVIHQAIKVNREVNMEALIRQATPATGGQEDSKTPA